MYTLNHNSESVVVQLDMGFDDMPPHTLKDSGFISRLTFWNETKG